MADQIISSSISLEEMDFENFKTKLIELRDILAKTVDAPKSVAIPVISTKCVFSKEGKQLEWIKLLRIDARIVYDLLRDFSAPQKEAERIVNDAVVRSLGNSKALYDARRLLLVIAVKEEDRIKKFDEIKKYMEDLFDISLKNYDFVEEKLGIKYYKVKE